QSFSNPAAYQEKFTRCAQEINRHQDQLKQLLDEFLNEQHLKVKNGVEIAQRILGEILGAWFKEVLVNARRSSAKLSDHLDEVIRLLEAFKAASYLDPDDEQ